MRPWVQQPASRTCGHREDEEMSNYPDDMDWAAYERAYGQPDLTISDDAHTMAALYWLTEYLGGIGDEDSMMAAIRDCVSESRLPEDREDAAEDEIYQTLRGLYKNEPNECMKAIGEEITCRQMKALRSIDRFLKRILTDGSKASENTCGESA